jgi:hypothetical protein
VGRRYVVRGLMHSVSAATHPTRKQFEPPQGALGEIHVRQHEELAGTEETQHPRNQGWR